MYVSAGAGFIVVSLGAISFIPGLPIKPAYYKIDLDLAVSPPRVHAIPKLRTWRVFTSFRSSRVSECV